MKKFFSSVLIGIVFVMTFSSCGKESADSQNTTLNESDTAVIETAYGVLLFPVEMVENVKHTEVTEGNIAMEIFSMVVGKDEMELFRIYYSDPQMGVRMGSLNIDEKLVPVSYTVCEYNEEDFPNEETASIYYELMKAFNTVLLSITEDPRFLPEGTVLPLKDVQINLKYWNTTVKENMEWYETTSDGIYRVDFYGNILDEKVPLYTIALGEIECDSILGVYHLDGQALPISLKVHEMPDLNNWTEETQVVFYRMMDTMNNIISEIIADKNYAQG